MRIAIDARATQTPHRHRGIGRSVLDLIEALKTYGGGHEYGLLVQSDLPVALGDLPTGFQLVPVSGSLLVRGAMSWAMKVPGLRGHPLGKSLNEAILLGKHRSGVRRALREFRPDVFHATVPIDEYTDTTGVLGGRKVVTFYDAITNVDPERYYVTMGEGARRQYDRQLADIAHADAVIAISHSSRQEAIQYAGADPARTHVVHLAMSDDFARETHESVERFTRGEPYFLFLSALSPHKNPLGVLRAFAKVSTGHRMVFLSSHKSDLYREVVDLVHGLGLEESVTVTDTVSEDAVRALVQGATALVSPSFYEGFGLPAVQAMGVGVPPIVSNRKSQPEVVGDAGLIVDPDDVDALARAMHRLASDAGLRRELGERGRERAALFSLERLARNTIDVYEGRTPSWPIETV